MSDCALVHPLVFWLYSAFLVGLGALATVCCTDRFWSRGEGK